MLTRSSFASCAAVFYWYVEATESPETAPVSLWTNGGPGCSGLIGFMTEQGPFHVGPDGGLEKNGFAWNTVANMLFIEQPVGVGFSYSTDEADNTMGDWDAARDNFAAIQVFLERFPAIAGNDFYISAESYGGHYMPTLAKYIVDHTPNPINFKGFAVGNPFTSKYSNTYGEITTLWGHQLTSKPLYDQWVDDCTGWYFNNMEAEKKGLLGDRLKPYKCLMDETEILERVEFSLNPYALDYPTCPKKDATGKKVPVAVAPGERGGGRFGSAQRLALMRQTFADEPQVIKAVERALARGAAEAAGVVPGSSTDDAQMWTEYEPCSDDYANTYLNRLDVQQAIHVNGGAAKANDTLVEWEECSRKIRYNTTDGRTPMMPIYSYLLNASNNFNLKIMVFSGDDDMVCATSGSQEWIYDLGFEVMPNRSWHAWHYEDAKYGEQTAGFVVNFKEGAENGMSGHFAFVTAHGCGHEVPTYKPQLALELWKNYLSGDVYTKLIQ